jgi:hypothetical protein
MHFLCAAALRILPAFPPGAKLWIRVPGFEGNRHPFAYQANQKLLSEIARELNLGEPEDRSGC